MAGYRRSTRVPTAVAGLLLVAVTVLALVMWKPFAKSIAQRRTEPSDAPSNATFAASDAQTPAKQSLSPEQAAIASLEPRDTDDLLNPHSGRRQTSHAMIPTAPPVASRIGHDPSIADPPAVPIVPLPPVDPVRPDPSREEPSSSDLHDPAHWTPPSPVRGPQLDNPHWPEATALLQLLEPLQQKTQTTVWASSVVKTLQRLETYPLKSADPQVSESIAALLDLAAQAKLAAASITDLRLRADLLRTTFAIERRATIWRDVAAILHPDTITVRLHQSTPEELTDLVGSIRSALRAAPQGQQWIDYLRLPDIEAALQSTKFNDPRSRSRLALSVLGRLHSPMLSESQSEFLEQPPYANLEPVLRQWVTEPVDYAQLVTDLEQYELYRASSEAHRIALAYHISRWSTHPTAMQLGLHLGDYYRNANARVAISAELINHLLPVPESVEEPVDDQIAGARVRGRSRASSRLRVFLIPDNRHWRLGLESAGTVTSETQAARGPARFFHNSNGQYRAHKILQVDQRGIRLWNTVADTDTDSELTGLETDFDSVPLLNVIARSLALNQYDRESDSARWQLRRRVTERIETRFDQEIEDKLREVRDQFITRFQQPMRKLQLNPTPIELETTDTRLIARYRLAGDHQLAGHTPRPQAPGDSWMSFQIHESAVNNILEQLQLDGRRIELRDLYVQIGELFHGKTPEIPEDMPEGVMLTFARQDAVRVRFSRDEITVALALRELSHKKHAWHNFVASAVYRPQIGRLDPTFERVDYVRLKGPRLTIKDQIVLRGIFSAVFKRRPPVHLLGDKIAQDEKFAHLDISQYVVRGGWIGVALSPLERGYRPRSIAKSAEELDLR